MKAMAYLFAIIVLLLVYIAYESIASRKERENFQLKLMSKSVAEYKEATEPEPESVVPEDELDEFEELENVSPEKLLDAKDNL